MKYAHTMVRYISYDTSEVVLCCSEIYSSKGNVHLHFYRSQHNNRQESIP